MGQLISYLIDAQTAGDAALLAALQRDDQVDLFFNRAVKPDDIAITSGLDLIEARTVGDAPWLKCSVNGAELGVTIKGKPITIIPQLPQTTALSGRNVALAIRNGESADAVLEWLEYHARTAGLNGAIIVSRAKHSDDKRFSKALKQGLKKSDHDMVVILVHVSVPLGHTDLPPEAHPYCVPEAPGKDRMNIPDPEPWSSPLGEVLIYELLRALFLSDARAVANIDVQDLMVTDGHGSIFDRAAASHTGVIQLIGRHCYPWRVRKGDAPAFGDHVCVQFDAKGGKRRWCVAPQTAPTDSVWRLVRIGGAHIEPHQYGAFYRCMALRHPTKSVSKIVPKTSLVEHSHLIDLVKREFNANPVRMPEEKQARVKTGKAAIITTMKNEGPFILEWLAYHRAIGFDRFLVYTNDCTDGTDDMFDLLQKKGLVQHRENPYRESGLKPQHAALQAGENEPTITESEWVTCIDVDEFINIKVGNGTLDDLFAAVSNANMIAMTWRLFGNNDIHEYHDGFLIENYTRCAPEYARKPHQAWGFKTLFQNNGIFKKLGVHRPKGLKPQLWKKINWVNGSGNQMPKEMYRNGWRSTTNTYGYDLVSLNHYAVRSAESFLVKRDRGRANHVDRDQGLAYWFRMNNNYEVETSIQKRIAMMKAEYDQLLSDPEIHAMHEHCVKAHKAKIKDLKATKNYSKFYNELISDRMQRLSRMHQHFGANVFLQGPESVPDDVVFTDHDPKFFFTVAVGETRH